MNQSPIVSDRKDIRAFDDITSTLTYYGNGSDIEVFYISDLHLDHHSRFYNSENAMIRVVVENLYQSIKVSFYRTKRIALFGGDIASSHMLAEKFYKTFVLRLKYELYEEYKKENSEWFGRTYDDIYKHELQKINNLLKTIEIEKAKIKKWIDYRIISRYENIYELKSYLASSYYTKRGLPEWVAQCIKSLFKKKKLLQKLQDDFKCIEEYRQNTEKVSLLEFDNCSEPALFDGIFAVLGNHELTEFKTVKEGVNCYNSILKPLGITLLANSRAYDKDLLIYGGTGFAKYNDKWNATSIICCPGFSREDEVREGDIFEEEYLAARDYAIKNNLCFICVSHYPATDCLKKRDCEAVYFSGHNHRNEYIRNENLVVYADNQIGYTSNSIAFKKAIWGLVINPYCSLEEGAHLTTVPEYLQFYRYIGEYVGNGDLISKRCEKGDLYVIKSSGYYGFFIKDKKGISIVNGGKTKRICTSTNIDWIYDNFSIVVEKYYNSLAPLRKLQTALSSELKALGFDGTIHGCIVDVDFYNHILINPSNGELTFYYSDVWGRVQEHNSFMNLLTSMEKRALASSYTMGDAQTIAEKKKLFALKYNVATMPVSTYNCALASQGCNYETEDLVSVSRSEGPYEASRKINSLQRLFTGRVLRDFDVSLTEINNLASPKRKMSYIGWLCYIRDVRCVVTKDDYMDLLEFTEVDSGIKRIVSLIEFRADIERTAQRIDSKRSYWETHSLKETADKYPEILSKWIYTPEVTKTKLGVHSAVMVSTAEKKQLDKSLIYKQKIGIVDKIDVENYLACNRLAQYKCLMCGQSWTITPNAFQKKYNNRCPYCKN